jgi:hypothetical protein
MKKYFKLILLWGIVLIFLTGCVGDLVVPEDDVVNSSPTEGSSIDENPAGGLGTGKGTLKIYLTDAPGDFLQLNIIVSRIEGHIAVEGEEEEGYWETLQDWEPVGLPVDLLTLQGVSLLLGSSDLPANHYTQLRVFLKEEAELVLEGEEGEPPVTEILKIPSSENTGIKLNRPFDIFEGGITILTLDFDAQKSVIKTGNGKYKMKPVITLLSESYLSEELPEVFGSVSGNVYYDSLESGIGGANIELAGGAYIFANTTTTSGEGEFSLINVPAGTYTLNVVADGYYNYSEIDVGVTAGADTEVIIELFPRGITGMVVSSEDQSVIEGANVSVELDSVITSTVTGTGGVFSIEYLPVGSYNLSVTADDYDPYSTSGIVVEPAGVITDIGTIELDPTL